MTTKLTSINRRLVAGLVAVLLAVGMVGTFDMSNAMATPTGKAMAPPYLNIRADASGQSAFLGGIPYGVTFEIPCTKRGTAVTGPWRNTSTIWDKVNYQGISGYVSDAWVLTGTDNPVSGDCGSGGGGGGGGGQVSREQRALSWAQSMLGRTGYYWYCDRFVANAYGAGASGYYNAYAHYQRLRSLGQIHTDGTPPAGALVFFGPASVNGNNGHVMLSEGNGSYLTGGDTVVKRVSINWPGAPYVGWSWADSSYPGR